MPTMVRALLVTVALLCTGPIVCGAGGAGGGSCPLGQTCQPFPVPSGCPLTGACLCQ